jgi:RsiW-degrading membrane proteinase PrsW (M82 family)
MDDNPDERPWKRIVKLTLWLYLMTPVGLWKLWHDPMLSTSAKWRIILYAFLIPTLVYITASVWMTNVTLQRLIP